MKNKKVLGALIGGITLFMPFFGSFALGVFLCIKKKFKLLFIPVFSLLFFIVAMVLSSDSGRTLNRQELRTSLEQAIENKFFSIPFSPTEKLTTSSFSTLIRKELKDDVSFDKMIRQEQERYARLEEKLYLIYFKEYEKHRSESTNFTIPLTSRSALSSDLTSFSWTSAEVRYPDPKLFSFSLIAWVILYFFSIPFGAYCGYKYLFQEESDGYQVRHVNPFGTKATSEEVINDNTEQTDAVFEEIETDTQISSEPVCVNMNELSQEDIQTALNVTIIQAKMIYAERVNQGDFLNYEDFLKRTNLSERICNQFKDKLIFLSNSKEDECDKKPGRVFDL